MRYHDVNGMNVLKIVKEYLLSKWRFAIVIGASSGIGEALARQLSSQGCKVALVARRTDKLNVIADELGSAAKDRPLVFEHDVLNTADVPGLFEKICKDLGGLDLFIFSTGVMPVLPDDMYDTASDLNVIETNVAGAVAWINEAADRFQKTRFGTIVGIGSVAGDRGRRGMPVYGASKAFLETYLEAIRNRTARYGVKVVTVKPGPVDTPMTQGIGRPLPMLISANDAAATILRASENDGVVYVPWQWKPIMWIIRHIPSFVMKRINI